ncbi:universal stress protein [Martelella radicis]|uniref:Nucleotide-binding universal stress UspA family protein n=1 Tax=Martelella radicis TaxID=1397476 RepID=A0A7W6KMF4_9HYPH|nr:universal stress protein [Martelella radicis]MBB4123887.1 nucleotide-binding universal stress UspA family protein [Martelella radicis]
MTYKTILAVMESPTQAGGFLDYAIEIVRSFDAHLIGLHAETVNPTPIIAPMEIPDPISIQSLQDMAEKRSAELGEIFRKRAAREDISHEWRKIVSASGFAGSSVIDSARSCDLIIAPQVSPDAPGDARADFESFLFESGRPVLLVPHVDKVAKPFNRVMVAWNGSREAARATFDALPFLKKAGEVEIFSVNPHDSKDQESGLTGAEIASTLARHGVNVIATSAHADKAKAATIIENRLSDNSVDLLVMGAYTHSRLWEMLFGGVTRTLLESMTAATLMSR